MSAFLVLCSHQFAVLPTVKYEQHYQVSKLNSFPHDMQKGGGALKEVVFQLSGEAVP